VITRGHHAGNGHLEIAAWATALADRGVMATALFTYVGNQVDRVVVTARNSVDFSSVGTLLQQELEDDSRERRETLLFLLLSVREMDPSLGRA
jgi:hypothetical protein